MVNREKLLAANMKMARLLQSFSRDDRVALACALLTQEICTLPAARRADALAEVVAELPAILRSTEEGMRLALVQNAKEGL